MRLIIILSIGLFLAACKPTKSTVKNWNTESFTLFDTKDTINLQITYFHKNVVYCFTEAIPYALIIGRTNNSAFSNIPKIITVLARCDNNTYTLGQNIKVLPLKDPTTVTTLRPLLIVKDTVINNQKHRWIIGSENPAIWGRVL